MLTLELPAFQSESSLCSCLELRPPLPDTGIFDPCGRAFLRSAGLHRDRQGRWDKSFPPNAVATPTDPGAPSFSKREDPGSKPRQHGADGMKKSVKISEEEFQVDWYDVIGLQSLEEAATEDDIRLAYRRRALETHPDKHRDGITTEQAAEEFKRLQRAFEILSDPDSRRAYDSARPFDDAIPDALSYQNEESYAKVEDAFFEAFGPVFVRNKKWSVEESIPLLGDKNTPLPDVHRFYSAWYAFRSWRDFTSEAGDELEQVDEGMERDERRFFLRENQRVLQRLARIEAKRIRTLVERAYAADPRLHRERIEQDRAREEDRKQREMAREQRLAEDRRLKAKAAEEKLAAQRAAAEKVRQEKAACESARLELHELFSASGLLDGVMTNKLLDDRIRLPNIDFVASKMNSEELGAFIAKMRTLANRQQQPEDIVAAFNKEVLDREQLCGTNRYGEPVATSSPKTKQRCQQGEEASKPKRQAEWTEEDEAVLRKAIAKFPRGTVDRWRKMAMMLRGKFSEEEIIAKTREVETKWKTDRSVMKQAAPSLPQEQQVEGERPLESSGSTSHLPAGPSPGDAKGTEAPAVEDWTLRQQQQLENGLRELRGYSEKDKFVKVAASVEGKTAKECYQRFKFLCNLNKGKK